MRGTSLEPEKVPPKWLPRVRGLGEKADSQRVHRLKCRRPAASSLLMTRYRKVEPQQHCLPCCEYRDTKLSRKLPSAPITGMSAMEGETRKRPLSAWEELKHQPWLGWGSRKFSFIRVLCWYCLFVFFFLISKIKERFIKWDGGAGRKEMAREAETPACPRLSSASPSPRPLPRCPPFLF